MGNRERGRDRELIQMRCTYTTRYTIHYVEILINLFTIIKIKGYKLQVFVCSFIYLSLCVCVYRKRDILLVKFYWQHTFKYNIIGLGVSHALFT